MAKEKAMPVANKIYFLPIYPDVVRAVRYGSVPCADVIKALKPVIAEHGQQQVDDAARELLDYDYEGKVLCARLKPHLRVQCRQILGPLPEEGDEFWKNADGSRPKNAPPVAKPTLRKPDQTEPPAEKPEPKKRAKAEESTPQEARVRTLGFRELSQQFHAARGSLLSNGPRSFLGKEAKKEVALLEAEIVRRGYVVPETPPEPVKRKRGA